MALFLMTGCGSEDAPAQTSDQESRPVAEKVTPQDTIADEAPTEVDEVTVQEAGPDEPQAPSAEETADTGADPLGSPETDPAQEIDSGAQQPDPVEPDEDQKPDETGGEPGFGMAKVEARAKQLAARPFEPGTALPKAAAELDYDQFRRIQNQDDSILWSEASSGFRVHLDPRGYLFKHEIKINIVDDTGVVAKPYDGAQFDFLDLPLSEEIRGSLGFSGFRIVAPFN